MVFADLNASNMLILTYHISRVIEILAKNWKRLLYHMRNALTGYLNANNYNEFKKNRL